MTKRLLLVGMVQKRELYFEFMIQKNIFCLGQNSGILPVVTTRYRLTQSYLISTSQFYFQSQWVFVVHTHNEELQIQ